MTTAKTRKIYRVELPHPKHGYNYVEMTSEREEWETEDPYVVVWLDVKKVQKWAAACGQKMPGTVDQWNEDHKAEYFAWAWDPKGDNLVGGLTFMPRVSAEVHRVQVTPSCRERLLIKLGLADGLKDRFETYVAFGNGRHRTEFLKDQGVRKMPFECRKECAALLQRLCT